MKYIINSVIICVFCLVSFFAVAAPIDINTADANSLANVIDGVGVKKAQAIIVYRKEHGPFKTVNDLIRVKGIGIKTVEKNRVKITAIPPKREAIN